MRSRSSHLRSSILAGAIVALAASPPVTAGVRGVSSGDQKFEGPVEWPGSPGAVLTVEFRPDGYIVPTEVDAHVKVTSQGKPVAGANLELVLWKGPHSPFTTKGKTAADGTAILTIPGDGTLGTDRGWVWIPESVEDTWKPGQARPASSVDFMLFWAVIYAAITGDWETVDFCLWMLGYVSVPDAWQQAVLLRQYRDEVLGRSDRGRLYIRLYYEHGAEVAHLAITHPHIGAALTNALVRYGHQIEQLGVSGPAEITDQDLSHLKGIIDSIQPYASEQLQRSLIRLRDDLANSRAREELGFVVSGGR